MHLIAFMTRMLSDLSHSTFWKVVHSVCVRADTFYTGKCRSVLNVHLLCFCFSLLGTGFISSSKVSCFGTTKSGFAWTNNGWCEPSQVQGWNVKCLARSGWRQEPNQLGPVLLWWTVVRPQVRQQRRYELLGWATFVLQCYDSWDKHWGGHCLWIQWVGQSYLFFFFLFLQLQMVESQSWRTSWIAAKLCMPSAGSKTQKPVFPNMYLSTG